MRGDQNASEDPETSQASHLAEMRRRLAEAELEDDAIEMQKLVRMCDRLRSEGLSLPKDEIDGLSALVGRLSQLMDRRRISGRPPRNGSRQLQGNEYDDATDSAALNSVIHQPSAQEKQAFGTARDMLDGALKSTEDSCVVRGSEQRPAVPKLRGMPSASMPSAPGRDVDQDRDSPRDVPVLR